jgi:hypothetical protein
MTDNTDRGAPASELGHVPTEPTWPADTSRTLVPMTLFGTDHWSTFAYVETRAVEHKGLLDHDHMRCHAGRHPVMLHAKRRVSAGSADGSRYPTRIKASATPGADGRYGVTEVPDHDDYDCLDDLIAGRPARTPDARRRSRRLVRRRRPWLHRQRRRRGDPPRVRDRPRRAAARHPRGMDADRRRPARRQPAARVQGRRRRLAQLHADGPKQSSVVDDVAQLSPCCDPASRRSAGPTATQMVMYDGDTIEDAADRTYAEVADRG